MKHHVWLVFSTHAAHNCEAKGYEITAVFLTAFYLLQEAKNCLVKCFWRRMQWFRYSGVNQSINTMVYSSITVLTPITHPLIVISRLVSQLNLTQWARNMADIFKAFRWKKKLIRTTAISDVVVSFESNGSAPFRWCGRMAYATMIFLQTK